MSQRTPPLITIFGKVTFHLTQATAIYFNLIAIYGTSCLYGNCKIIFTKGSRIYNTSHKLRDQSPSPHYRCCLQVSEAVSSRKLRCCYSTNILQHWIKGRGLNYFWKVGYSRISRNFSRNWFGLNNLREIL